MVKNIYSEIRELKEYAFIKKVPIMQDDGISFVTDFITQHDIKSILEIGTAIGYSSIMMALSAPDVAITTIEKDRDRYLEAVKNVKRFNLEDRIILIYSDALEVKLKDNFDLIFIDAAKSKNTEIFNHFEKNLNSKGYVITDNIYFHGYVDQDESEIKSKNIRGLVRKIKSYIVFLENNIKYRTKFYKIGDGISVSRKRS